MWVGWFSILSYFSPCSFSVSYRPYKDSPKDDQKMEEIPEKHDAMPEKPAPKATAVSATYPPTLASGFGGVMTEDDHGKSPIEILNDHELKVKAWVQTLDGPAVVKNLKVAASHPYYEKFLSQFQERKFGTGGRDDIVEFDNWLRKMEVSQKRIQHSPLSVATSEPEEPGKVDAPARGKGKGSAPAAAPVPAKASVPKPNVSDDATSTSKPDEPLPKLTPDQQKAYQNYWKKFSSQNLGAASTSPAMPATTSPGGTSGTSLPSPPISTSSSPPTVTPECKRRLDLDAAAGHYILHVCVCVFVHVLVRQPCKQNQNFVMTPMQGPSGEKTDKSFSQFRFNIYLV